MNSQEKIIIGLAFGQGGSRMKMAGRCRVKATKRWRGLSKSFAKKKIAVNDKMQKGYEYFLTEPAGENFAPEFLPGLTPKQMLAMGIFGGKYMTDCRKEFPKDWFASARLNSEFHDPKLNYFGVNASQSLSVWRKKGWIHPADPRGWFQWYCRYFMGRRMPEYDQWQIKRWKAMARHIAQIKKNCAPRDLSCRRRQRQAVLHWAYDARRI